MNRIAWIVVLCGCGGTIESKTEPPKPAEPAVPQVVLDGQFVEPLRDAARAYLAWGRVDARPNIAPMMCDIPRRRDYGSTGDVHLSSAGEESPHGRKLYYLYAKDRDGYRAMGPETSLPIGTTVVKEAFAPRPATAAEVTAMKALEEEDFIGRPTTRMSRDDAAPGRAYVELDGAYVVPDAALGLYIMTKVGDAAEPGTDDGWIYGTITPDGAVTSAGRVGTCMGCHVDQAPHERLFGLKPD
jgi:hypothetical protein